MYTSLCILCLLPGISYALVCNGLSNGNYEVSCRSYVHCENGLPTLHDCPYNLVYNNATRRCDDPKVVPPPCGETKDCSSLPDRRYADKDLGCHSYYTCQNHIYFGHNICAAGLVFNEVLQNCDWPRDVVQPCGTQRG